MKEMKYVLKDPEGFHARPATVFVKTVAGFKNTDIKIAANGKEANGKSMMALMAMCIKGGTEITISVSGEDEDAAMAAVEEALKTAEL